MLVDKGVFVLSLILESQSFDDKCLKRPSLYLFDSLLKEVCVLETFQFGLFTFLRDKRMSYHSCSSRPTNDGRMLEIKKMHL